MIGTIQPWISATFRPRSTSILLLASFLILFASGARGAQPDLFEQAQAKAEAGMRADMQSSQAAALAKPGSAECPDRPPEVAKACNAALKADYDYESARLDHRRRTFEDQLIASNVILIVVILLVLSGLAASAIQFRKSLGRLSDQPTEIEVSLQRIKVSSSILGVLLLGLSMGFFLLYAIYIYPITSV